MLNFDVNDVKSWANRHDVKVGDKGYFSDNISDLKNKTEYVYEGSITEIDDTDTACFGTNTYGRDYNTLVPVRRGLFLPVIAVKEEPKEKKYRYFKTTQELSDVVYGKDCEYGISTGREIIIRHKDDEIHRTQLLITRLDFEEELLGINDYSMVYWFKNYELMNNRGEWQPFGVEITDENNKDLKG